MDFMGLVGLLPTILRLVDFAKKAFQGGNSINAVWTIIQNALQNEDVRTLFNFLFAKKGAEDFPKVRPELQPAAAVVATYLPEYVMKVQNAVNILLDMKLDVDGHYGPLTKAAVEKLQKKLGLAEVDGWVGDKTMAAIQVALLKHSDEEKANATAAPTVLSK